MHWLLAAGLATPSTKLHLLLEATSGIKCIQQEAQPAKNGRSTVEDML